MITIKEVAGLAGVSKATVSRLLNNSGYVAPDTRRKIEAVIEKYNYIPSASAVSLSRQESATIGVVLPEIDNVFYAEVVHGITEAADKLNLSMVFFDTQNNLKKESHAFRMLQQQRVKGIILGPSVDYTVTTEGRSLLMQLEKLTIPIVIVDRDFENMKWDAVLFENFQSSYQAAVELCKAGNKRIATITGDMELKLARERFNGFKKGVEDCGGELREEDIYYGNFLTECAYRQAKKLLSANTLPDAVYTPNNRTTLGFLKAAHECGIDVGKDIALIGKDHIEAFDILGIGFSYVDGDNYEMGRSAVRLLHQRWEYPDSPRNINMIPYKVQLNGSEKKK